MASVNDPPSPLLVHLRLQDGWDNAIERLRVLRDEHPERLRRADSYGSLYAGARAAMVFDVVASHRRDYQKVVLPTVQRFRSQWPDLTLAELATGNPSSGFGLPAERWTTIIGVAAGFDRYRTDRSELLDASDDDVVTHWAAAVEPVRLTQRLDPYVGSVSGIGVALFAYARMRSGADAPKPDRRFRDHLKHLEFPTPAGEGALLLVGEAAAEEVGIHRLELDQLLW